MSLYTSSLTEQLLEIDPEEALNYLKDIVNPNYNNWIPLYDTDNKEVIDELSFCAGEYFYGISSPNHVFGESNLDKKRIVKSFRPKGKISTIRELFRAIEQSKYITLSDQIWSSLDYASTVAEHDQEDIIEIALTYAYSERPYYERILRMIVAIAEDIPLPAAAILKKNNQYQILGGNRRLMASKFHGVRPKVHIITID